jgi:hypothetical protein
MIHHIQIMITLLIFHLNIPISVLYQKKKTSYSTYSFLTPKIRGIKWNKMYLFFLMLSFTLVNNTHHSGLHITFLGPIHIHRYKSNINIRVR